MSFYEEFQSNLETLPNILQRKYALLQDLDKSLQEILRQNEQRCEQEMEDYKRGVIAGAIARDSSLVKFSDEAVDEQKHAIRIADEKVALAVQAYDLVDAHIQQLDQQMKFFNEELQRERLREKNSATGSPDSNFAGGVKSESIESGRGWRKKTRLVAAAAAATAVAKPTGMELDLPVDPNEPTYCFCNQVSYGDMVACDNSDCKIEWFHFGCVGLKLPLRGKWYCSDCVGMQKKHKKKK